MWTDATTASSSGHALRRDVERAVLGDVRLGPDEHRERAGARVQGVDLAALRAEVRGEEPARHGAVARVVREERVRVPARLERAVERREGHPAVRAVRVEVRVAAQVRVGDARGRRQDAVHVRARQEVRLAVARRDRRGPASRRARRPRSRPSRTRGTWRSRRPRGARRPAGTPTATRRPKRSASSWRSVFAAARYSAARRLSGSSADARARSADASRPFVTGGAAGRRRTGGRRECRHRASSRFYVADPRGRTHVSRARTPSLPRSRGRAAAAPRRAAPRRSGGARRSAARRRSAGTRRRPSRRSPFPSPSTCRGPRRRSRRSRGRREEQERSCERGSSARRPPRGREARGGGPARRAEENEGPSTSPLRRNPTPRKERDIRRRRPRRRRGPARGVRAARCRDEEGQREEREDGRRRVQDDPAPDREEEAGQADGERRPETLSVVPDVQDVPVARVIPEEPGAESREEGEDSCEKDAKSRPRVRPAAGERGAEGDLGESERCEERSVQDEERGGRGEATGRAGGRRASRRGARRRREGRGAR